MSPLYRLLALPSLSVLVLAACSDDPMGPGGEPVPEGPLDVFVHAHQDDWQLFMGDRVESRTQEGGDVVLVYTTAGDAGSDPAYWAMRHRAAKASVDLIAGSTTESCEPRDIGGQVVERCTQGSVVSYFMGLPDGNWEDGTGYGFGSLSLLRDSAAVTRTRDGTASYASWDDFTDTLAGIVEEEAAGREATRVTVHAPDFDRAINPVDHPDHWATGDAVLDATNGRGWTVRWYVDYATEWMEANLDESTRNLKYDLFKAYDDVMAASGYESLLDRPNFQAWLWRTYFR